jgi:restriction system protein
MAVPTYDQFIEPVLLYLAQHPDGVPARQVYEAAADALGLDEEDKQLLLASAPIPVYKNRAAWAHDRLKRAGLSSSPQRGMWQLTPQGIRFAADHPAPHSRSSRCSGS